MPLGPYEYQSRYTIQLHCPSIVDNDWCSLIVYVNVGTTHRRRKREKEKEDKEEDREQENPDFVNM